MSRPRTSTNPRVIGQREAQRLAIQARRAAYFAGKACAKCKATDRKLTLDHVDPKRKVSHKVWTWATPRREAELSKCQPLCADCHVEKSRGDTSGLTREKAESLRAEVAVSGRSIAAVARANGIKPRALQRIVRGERWAAGHRPGWAGIGSAQSPTPAVSR